MDRADRVKLLYLNDDCATVRPPLGLPSATLTHTSVPALGQSRYRNSASVATRSSAADVTSVGSSDTHSDTASDRRPSLTSTDSEAPSIHIAPPWVENPPIAMTAVQYSYDLPCEFAEMFYCDVRFHPEQWESWIDHGASHFIGTGPPEETNCLFCGDSFSNWTERMNHIGSHWQDGATIEMMRPDFSVINQLYRANLLTDEEYKDCMSYTERPSCENLVDEDFKTPEMEAREQREGLSQTIELQKERRQQKVRGKGKAAPTYKPSPKRKVDILQELRS